MVTQRNKHDAAPSATGYLYQCRLALLLGLKAIADNPEFRLSIEKLDDIAFELDGDPVERLQVKHHVKRRGKLTDASVDLWKTFGIWANLTHKDNTVPFRERFMLITTAIAPNAAAASYLRARDRDEETARTILAAAASRSNNKANTNAYEAFMSLSCSQQLSLLRAITIADGSPNIIDVYDEICRELRHAASPEKLPLFVQRLEGWWFGILIKSLADGGSITVLAVENRLDELREELSRKALPLDYDQVDPPESVVADLDKRPFVRQLRHIQIGDRRIEFAIRDYYRASEQRGRWAREELLIDGELDRYEQELVEAWEPRFEAAREAAGNVEEAKLLAGQRVFVWAETEAAFPLRNLRNRFLTHGSFHILANRHVIGWHPDYIATAESGNDE